MTQQERLIKHFKRTKTIDPLRAWTKLGIYRLADCVYNLRKKGYAIETTDKRVKNTFNETCIVAEYRIRGML
jgi:hypothetical protein|tara:strand:- start:624 stop:839 length:216 start_codon:yes stop_codon:yes gene_type:complete